MTAPTDADRIMPLEATRAEIAGTPVAMSHALDRLAGPIRDLATALTLRQIARVAIIGAGDSLAVGMMAVAGFAQFAGKPLDPIQAYEFATYGHPDFGSDRAAILISSSGRPSPVWDALTRALTGDAFVVGISDRTAPDNPLLGRPGYALCPGAAKRGVPTKSTSLALAVLLRLAIEWGHMLGNTQLETALEELLIMPKRLEFVARTHANAVLAIAASFGDRRHIHIVGAGPNAGTAQAAALLFAAGAGLSAAAHTVEEFHHALKLAGLTRRDLVLVLAPAGSRGMALLTQTIAAAKARDAQVIVLGAAGLGGSLELPLPRTIEALSPLMILPLLQQMALGAGLAIAQDATQSFRTGV